MINDLTDVKIFLDALIRPIVYEAVKAATNHPAPPPPLSEPDEPLTPDETAALLKTSKVSLWSWEKKGIIKGYHLGNKKYFLRSEIVAALTRKGGTTL